VQYAVHGVHTLHRTHRTVWSELSAVQPTAAAVNICSALLGYIGSESQSLWHKSSLGGGGRRGRGGFPSRTGPTLRHRNRPLANIELSPVSDTSCLLNKFIYFINKQDLYRKCLKPVTIQYFPTDQPPLSRDNENMSTSSLESIMYDTERAREYNVMYTSCDVTHTLMSHSKERTRHEQVDTTIVVGTQTNQESGQS